MKFNKGSIIAGLIIIVIGVLFLLKNAGIELGFNVKDLWPVIFIVIGLGQFSRPLKHNLIKSLGFVVLGVFLLLKTLGYIDYGFDVIWPLILIFIGILVIFGSGCNRAVSECRKNDFPESSDDLINLSVSLAEGTYSYNSMNFKGGNLSVFMGGCNLDLTNTDFDTENIVLDISVIMGEINLIIPQNWKVNLQISPKLAEIKDRSRFTELNDKKSKTMIIQGSVFMGGINIRN